MTAKPTETKIDCPEHPGQHQVTLYINDSEFAGMWECDETGEGISDMHDHAAANEDTYTEEHETWPTGPDDDGDTITIEYWALCGTPVEG